MFVIFYQYSVLINKFKHILWIYFTFSPQMDPFGTFGFKGYIFFYSHIEALICTIWYKKMQLLLYKPDPSFKRTLWDPKCCFGFFGVDRNEWSHWNDMISSHEHMDESWMFAQHLLWGDAGTSLSAYQQFRCHFCSPLDVFLSEIGVKWRALKSKRNFSHFT